MLVTAYLTPKCVGKELRLSRGAVMVLDPRTFESPTPDELSHP